MFGKFSKVLLGAMLIGGIMSGHCYEQRSRFEADGVDNEFFQRQYELQQSPVINFTKSELETIYSETKKENFDSAVPEDQTSLLPIVIAGNPAALFEFAQRDGGRARLAYNGEKRKLLLERGILLLIAAIQGDNYASKESLNYAADTPINYSSLNSLQLIIAKATELASKL